jgi:hypothetical protein
MDLKKWLQIMEAYEGGAPHVPLHHADGCAHAAARRMKETQAYGFAA